MLECILIQILSTYIANIILAISKYFLPLLGNKQCCIDMENLSETDADY